MPARVERELRSLTGLRAFAALAVFVVHTEAWTSVQGGRAGVSFFFILSGFVLAWSAQPGDRPVAFWRRRAARIIPAYLVAWVISLVIAAQLGGTGWVKTLPGWVFLQAWFDDVVVYFAANGVSWSLSCEALFYLLFPLLVWRMRHRQAGTLWVVLLGASASSLAVPVLLRNPDPNFFWAYIFPPTRLPEFLIGVCLAGLFRRGVRLRLPVPWAVALAVVALVAASAGPAWSSTVAITVVPFALLIAAAATSDLAETSGSWLRSSVLVTAGRWSYCFYLLHQLVIKEATFLGITSPGAAVPLTLAVSIVAAWQLHVLVEVPWEKRLRGMRQPSVTVGA